MSLEIAFNNTWHVFHIQDFDDLREQRRTNGQRHAALVTAIVASGDEMDFIRNNFSDIPKRHGNLNIWRGGMAKFIFENL